MNVLLTPEAARVVNEKIGRGEFQSPVEVVEEALRLLEERSVQEHARIDSLIREGLASEASEMTDQAWDDITREGAALIDARRPREA
jgi:putative addiction module CopG family antidote